MRKTIKGLEKELAIANKEIAKLKDRKLFDFLADGLLASEIEFEKDSIDFDDDHLEFHLYSENKETKYTIGFNFKEDGTMDGVRMFKCKKLHGYDEDNADQCAWTAKGLKDKAKWEQERKERDEKAKTKQATVSAGWWPA